MSKKFHVVSEYEYLYHQGESTQDTRYHKIDASTFSHLKHFILDNPELTDFLKITSHKQYGEVIFIQNYVGVIETTQQVTIEILPKTNSNDPNTTRKIFLKMLKELKTSPSKHMHPAHLKQKDYPLLEVFVSMFLDELEELIQQGLKKSYNTKHDNSTYLKGKLDIVRNMKDNLTHKERFAVSYDTFTENVPENRLIKSCLHYLESKPISLRNQKRIRKLHFTFDQIPNSNNLVRDFASCNYDNRLENYYTDTMKRVGLFLAHNSLVNFSGKHISLALLFPMERIFEDYVAAQLKKKYQPLGWIVKTQDSNEHLIDRHIDGPDLRLRPDIVMQHESTKETIVLDTKRKLLDQQRRDQRYDIKNNDIYQLYAYLQNYSCDSVYLIYPTHENFSSDLPVFEFEKDQKKLHVVGYDLANNKVELLSETPAVSESLVG